MTYGPGTPWLTHIDAIEWVLAERDRVVGTYPALEDIRNATALDSIREIVGQVNARARHSAAAHDPEFAAEMAVGRAE